MVPAEAPKLHLLGPRNPQGLALVAACNLGKDRIALNLENDNVKDRVIADASNPRPASSRWNPTQEMLDEVQVFCSWLKYFPCVGSQ
jgi:hypothetical protein